MSNYDEKAKLREALEVGLPKRMFAALTGITPGSDCARATFERDLLRGPVPPDLTWKDGHYKNKYVENRWLGWRAASAHFFGKESAK